MSRSGSKSKLTLLFCFFFFFKISVLVILTGLHVCVIWLIMCNLFYVWHRWVKKTSLNCSSIAARADIPFNNAAYVFHTIPYYSSILYFLTFIVSSPALLIAHLLTRTYPYLLAIQAIWSNRYLIIWYCSVGASSSCFNYFLNSTTFGKRFDVFVLPKLDQFLLWTRIFSCGTSTRSNSSSSSSRWTIVIRAANCISGRTGWERRAGSISRCDAVVISSFFTPSPREFVYPRRAPQVRLFLIFYFSSFCLIRCTRL